jgi:hypothetical protein
MQLLWIFSGRNRHEPENFQPGPGCSKKFPGHNAIETKFPRPDFTGKISGKNLPGDSRQEIRHLPVSHPLPSKPALIYKGSEYGRL